MTRLPSAVALLCACSWVLAAGPAAAQDVALAKVFGDHMVLQAGVPVRVWGTAAPGEEILMSIGSSISGGTRADERGEWSLTHPALAASHEPTTIRVDGTSDRSDGQLDRVVISDVLVGEVWVAAGQSNMTFELRSSRGAEEALAAADRPHVRLLNWKTDAYPTVGLWSDEKIARCTPQEYMRGKWALASPESARSFSAVAWHFAARLDEELDVPIGIVHCSVGGTPTEAWIARETLAADEDLARLLVDWPSDPRLHPFVGSRAKNNLGDAFEHVLASDGALGHAFLPGWMHTCAIAHLEGMPMAGVIWYQGESNSTDPVLHARLFRTLVRDWRRRWGIGDFPFLFCQLSSIGTERGYRAELWPEFRDSQRRMRTEMPPMGMAVTSDVGHAWDVHPKDKRTVGRRLARWALAECYGWEGVVSGPLYASWERDGAVARVRFEYGEGMRASTGHITGFEVSGVDGVYVPALARVLGDTVVLWAEDIPRPAAVRYGWTPFSAGNLVNGAGLPASTFTTAPD